MNANEVIQAHNFLMTSSNLPTYDDMVNAHDDLVAALERLLAAHEVAREYACARPMMENELVTNLQCSGGAVAEARAILAKVQP